MWSATPSGCATVKPGRPASTSASSATAPTKSTPHAAALAAGGQDDGGAGPRPHFGPGYYAGNVTDLDDNRIEFVHKAWNPTRPA